MARAAAGFDIGQTATVRRAGLRRRRGHGRQRTRPSSSAGGERIAPWTTTLHPLTSLTVVGGEAGAGYALRCAVIGIATVETIIRAGAGCLSVEAGRTLRSIAMCSFVAPPRQALPLSPPRADTECRQGLGTRDIAVFHKSALCQGTTSQAAEKLWSGGRRGFQPPHKANRINGALAPEGRFSPISPEISSFSAACSVVPKRTGLQGVLTPEGLLPGTRCPFAKQVLEKSR